MKNLVVALILLINYNAFAQKPCEIDTDFSDSIGTFKSTKQYMIFERNFAGNSTNFFFSLTNTNGIIGIDLQVLQRSQDFIKAICFDANSKVYLQLQNGKIVMLLHNGNDDCGTYIRDNKNGNNRILSGSFLFSKENYEDLKTSSVTFMRMKYSGETIDYPFRSEFVADLDKKMYEPEKYFINFIKCIEN
jgi:hypothetical protein